MELARQCLQCRFLISPGARFCERCGLAAENSAFEVERRQLTLLFCDMVGSTALSERLDPEDLRDLLTSYQRLCRDAIGRYEGHISQFLGDGVMSYFGYPIAHEDDAVRAVGAALSVLEAARLVNQGIGKRLRAEIHVRIGIHTGVAVVGDLGPGGAHDRLAVGETINLASRIQTFADVDSVLVSAATARLVEGHFELQAREAQTLRGFSRPVGLFRVVRPTGARTKFEATARGTLTPHVGRERELAELAAAWNDVRHGADRIVVVRGEAGIGKSRIVHHFRQLVVEEEARILQCLCSPLAQATALAPVVEMLNGRLLERSEGNATPSAKLEALRSLLGEHARFGAEALPLMATLLSIPGADDKPIQELSPVRRRARTLEIMSAWMAWSAERWPLALFVEDVHWADPSTLDLLDRIVADSPGGRTLLCVTCRPEFLVRWSRPDIRIIELLRLRANEIEAMVTHVAGHELPPLVVRRIADRSEGVPLFVEEVTKAVLESGALRLEGNRYELVRSLDDGFLPSTVQGSLVARFDRLGRSRSVAQLGAAIGREFTYQLIAAVANLSDEELREHLDLLSRSELAIAHGDPPNSVYTFKHALIQDAIYATLLKSERARVHQRIFAALTEKFPELVEARPEMAAYHAENAGRRGAAVPLLRSAGINALGRVAVAEAVKHLSRGIELVGVLDDPARTAMEIEFQAAIGPAYMATVGWAAPEVERASERLRDLAAAKGDGPRLFQAMWGLWTVNFLRGQLDAAVGLAGQVLEMAIRTEDPMLRVAGHHALGYTHFYRGEYSESIRHADAGLALFDLDRERKIISVLQLSSSCAIWCFRAQAQQMLGYAEEASQSVYRCKRLDETLGHAPSRAYLLCLCYYFRMLDDVETIKTWAPATRSLSLAEGFSFWVLVADIFLAWVSARQGGDRAAAVEKIERSRKLLHDSRTHLVEPEYAALHAETLLLAGRPDEVFRVAQDALAISQRGEQRHGQAELFRLQGDAARAIGDHQGAVTFYRQGIESARSTNARLLELRSALAMVRLSDGCEERAELKRILDAFPEARGQPDCRQAIALLET